jgi:Pentapeptide repeats (8 copies)
MKTKAPHNWRRTAAVVAALGVVSGGAAFAQWPFGPVVKLEPGYGGLCEDCDLSGRILVAARLTNGVFHRANFRGAVMSHADGSGSAFDEADFTDAILDDAKFAGVLFGRARMTRARMARTDFSGADLSRVIGLTQAQLSEACGDDRTLLPRGLAIPLCPAPKAPRTPLPAKLP